MSARAWPASSVEHRQLDDLVPSARNSRAHSDVQIAQIAASMKRFGWATHVLVDEAGEIIAGHGRVLAARALLDAGHAEFATAPVAIARDWSDEEKLAYQIADNKLALNAEWNMAALSENLLSLDAANFDTALLGFSDAELTNILAPIGEIDRENEWRAMPEYAQEDQMAFRTIKIHFRNQLDVESFARLLAQSVTDKTKFLWYPELEIERVADKRYVAAES